MYIVAGAPGSGKSSLIPVSSFGVNFFNADDEAAKFNNNSYLSIPQSVRHDVNLRFASFIAEHIRLSSSFAVETTLRTNIALVQAGEAHQAGFRTSMFYIGTENISINLARVANRADAGGHSAPEAKLRSIHADSYATLPLAIEAVGESLDELVVLDNSVTGEDLIRAFRLAVDKQGLLFLPTEVLPPYLSPYYNLALARL